MNGKVAPAQWPWLSEKQFGEGKSEALLVGLALASKPELKPSFKSPHPLKLGIPNTEGSSHQESLWSAKAFLNHLSFGHGAERC